MKPADLLKCIYTKDKSVTYVNEQWVALYLNKILLQNPDNAKAIERCNEYTFYISPTHYFYLLYFMIPKKTKYNIRYMKKDEEKDEDALIERLKYVLGWSNREYDKNKSIVERTILTDRPYWLSEMGLTDGSESKQHSNRKK